MSTAKGVGSTSKNEGGDLKRKKKISLLEIKELIDFSQQRTKPETGALVTARSHVMDKMSMMPMCPACIDTDMNVQLDALDTISDEISIITKSVKNSHMGNLSQETLFYEFVGQIEARAFVVILREAATAIDILGHTIRQSSEEKLSKPGPPVRVTMRKKQSLLAKDEKDMYFGEDFGFVRTEPMIRDKLTRDRDVTHDLFCDIANELEQRSCCDCLIDEVNRILQMQDMERSLKSNLKMWSELVLKLKFSQKNFETDFESRRKKYLEEAEELDKNIDSSYCANNEKLNYVTRWEASKLEQQIRKLSLQEEGILNQIKKLEKSRAVDAKVSQELCFYMQTVIKSYEDDIAAWTNQLNDEISRRQIEITDVEEKIEQTKVYMEESRKLQRLRQEVIDVENESKRQENEEKAYLKSVNESATIIQALWRGYMVRHRLGEYASFGHRRKSKKKSKNAKKKAAKKSKK